VRGFAAGVRVMPHDALMKASTAIEDVDSCGPYDETVRLPVLNTPSLSMPFEIIGEGPASEEQEGPESD